MIEHILTMHHSDPKKPLELWITCSCGWEGPRHPMTLSDDPKELTNKMVEEAKKHQEEKGESSS